MMIKIDVRGVKEMDSAAMELSGSLEYRAFDSEMQFTKEVSRKLERALTRCREGQWARGLRGLLQVAESRETDLPSLYYSYLGRAIASQERRVSEGLLLCRHAVRLECYQPENYANLARTYLLAGRRREAFQALARGLAVDADHPDLLNLRIELGARREPVLRFMSRCNPINQLLGRIRHGLDASNGQTSQSQ